MPLKFTAKRSQAQSNSRERAKPQKARLFVESNDNFRLIDERA